MTDTYLRDLSEAEHFKALDPRNEPDEVRRCDVDPVWKEEEEEEVHDSPQSRHFSRSAGAPSRGEDMMHPTTWHWMIWLAITVIMAVITSAHFSIGNRAMGFWSVAVTLFCGCITLVQFINREEIRRERLR